MKKIFSSNGLRWMGVTILLLAYILVSQGVVDGQQIFYNAMNCFGSILMIVSSLLMKPKDFAVVAFNTVWVLIGVATIVSTLF